MGLKEKIIARYREVNNRDNDVKNANKKAYSQQAEIEKEIKTQTDAQNAAESREKSIRGAEMRGIAKAKIFHGTAESRKTGVRQYAENHSGIKAVTKYANSGKTAVKSMGKAVATVASVSGKVASGVVGDTNKSVKSVGRSVRKPAFQRRMKRLGGGQSNMSTSSTAKDIAAGSGKSKFGVKKSKFGVKKAKFAQKKEKFGVAKPKFAQTKSKFAVNRPKFGVQRQKFATSNTGNPFGGASKGNPFGGSRKGNPFR